MFEEIKTIVAENLGVEEDSITMESSFKDDLKADSLSSRNHSRQPDWENC